VAALPGTYPDRVASVRDGAPGLPITLTGVEPGSVLIVPAAGSGVVIGHHHHVIQGLTVLGGAVGIQVGPYKKLAEPVMGVEVRESRITGAGIGIKFEAVDSSALHNVIADSAMHGILWNKRSGDGATIFNNLLHGNGRALSGEFAVTLATGARHVVSNNTLYGNLNGGLRLGNSADDPVFSTVMNNIVAGSPVGVKEPGGETYLGRAVLDHNNVHSSSLRDYDLSGARRSVPGPGSISKPPRFVDPEAADFRLARRSTGQPEDSPCIDRGSDTAERLGLADRTAFTDKRPDTGPVDLGYHPTALRPAQARITVDSAMLRFDPGADRLELTVTLEPGADGDGLEPGAEYAELSVGGHQVTLPSAGFRPGGGGWTFEPAPGTSPQVAGGALTASAGGGATLTVLLAGLDLGREPLDRVTLRMGDDVGGAGLRLRGTLRLE
jgi:hypothetical protein